MTIVVNRYMVEDPTNRIVAHVFETEAESLDVEPSPVGRASIVKRETPTDPWGPPEEMTPSVEFALWVEIVDSQGFTFTDRTATEEV